jgi:hypothetical protein
MTLSMAEAHFARLSHGAPHLVRETALRAQTNLIEIDILEAHVQSAFEIVLGFERALLSM